MLLRIFKIRNVTGANLIMAPLYACGLGGFFITSLYMQTVLRFSPVSTGLSFIPYPIVLGITSFFIPNFVSKYGYKRFLIAGLILVGLALLWLARLPVDGSYFTNLLPALVLLPLGIGLTFTPLIASATSGVPRSEAGLAPGLITTSQQMGGALGLAILSGVATSVAASAINPHSRNALVHSYNFAFLTAVAFIIFAIILAITVIRQQPLRNREAQTIK